MFENSDATFLVSFNHYVLYRDAVHQPRIFCGRPPFHPNSTVREIWHQQLQTANYEEERINKEKVNRSNSRYKRKALAQRRHIANVGQIKSVTNHVRRVLEQADILGRYRNGKRTNFPERVRRLGCLLFQKYFCTFSRISNPQKTEQKLFQKIFKGTKIFLLHLFENIYF